MMDSRIISVVIIGLGLCLVAAGEGYSHGHDRGVIEGYGCGRHDATETTHSDPAEYDLPPCVEARKLWLDSETWSHALWESK